MPGIVKRADGKKHRIWWTDENGKRKYGTGFVGAKPSLELARELERQARYEREGLVEKGTRHRKTAEARPVADHVEDWRLSMLARGDKPKHAAHMAGAVLRLIQSAGVTSIGDPKPELIERALERLAVKRSARTRNHAAGAVKSFFRWLYVMERVREIHRGIQALTKLPEEADQRLIRRAFTADELARLIEAARTAPDRVASKAGRGGKVTEVITGPDRAVLYALAAGTGFRANELRSLTLESFDLGDTPTVTIHAAYSKNTKTAAQPIAPELADMLREHLKGRCPGRVFAVPEKTGEMIAADMTLAGIDYGDPLHRADFHSLRATYITTLVSAGVDAETCRKLARHSDVRLTLQRYTKTTARTLREAVESAGKKSA